MTTDVLAAKAGARKPPYRHPATGEVLPGVTTVLRVLDKGEGLLIWANTLGLEGIKMADYRDDLAAVGRCTHALILELLSQGQRPCDRNGYTPDQLTRAERCLVKFLAWKATHRLVTWHCERDLLSLVHGYGGTPDWVGLVDDVATVLDFKTGKKVYDEALYQTAAYRALVGEVTGEWPSAIRVLQIGRDETEGFSEKVIAHPDELARYWAVFEHCLALHRLLKGGTRKAKPPAPSAPAATGRPRSTAEGRAAIADLFGSR